MLIDGLPTVFVVFEIKSSGKDLIACISDRERARKLQGSGRLEIHEMVVNPLGGSYLAKIEKEIAETELNHKGPEDER